jgi:hypothetical protein
MRIRHDDLLTAERQPPVFAAIRVTLVKGRDGQVSLSPEEWCFVPAEQELEAGQVGAEHCGVVGGVGDEAVQ